MIEQAEVSIALVIAGRQRLDLHSQPGKEKEVHNYRLGYWRPEKLRAICAVSPLGLKWILSSSLQPGRIDKINPIHVRIGFCPHQRQSCRRRIIIELNF